MAKNALLIWCAGSALICGTAALATTSLWREPVEAASPAAANLIAPPETPGPLAGFAPPADGFVPLASVSFYTPAASGTDGLFRGTLDIPAASDDPPASPLAVTFGFAETTAEEAPSDPRLTVLPPPRPNFQLARLDTSAKAALTEVTPSQPVPTFQPPAPAAQGSSNWDWDNVFAPKVAHPFPGGGRVINSGIASWYGPGFHGRRTASGERFDQNDLTAAHRTLPFGTRVRVVDEKTGRSVIVRINDRGPFAHGRVIDLSRGAAQALGIGGLTRVKVVAAN